MKQGNAQLIITIEGKYLPDFSQEAGGHRIQRIPPNERRGRVHSSTVTVAVLEDVPLDAMYSKRHDDDFDISFFSGTGPGGQNRNKVQASARIKHIPTGLVRTAQTRSRENSVRLAMQALLEDLDAAGHQHKRYEDGCLRKEQVGSGMRGDKRRTYRTQEDQVTDHISGKKGRMSHIMKGFFDDMWN